MPSRPKKRHSAPIDSEINLNTDDGTVTIAIPGLPPSLWQAYLQRRGGAGKALTRESKEWLRVAILAARLQHSGEPVRGRLSVVVRFRAKDRGVWDIDNRYKLLLDALTTAGVWPDDNRIDALLGIVELDPERKYPETLVEVRRMS